MEQQNFSIENNKFEFKKKFNFLKFFSFIFFIVLFIIGFLFIYNIQPPKNFNTELIFSIEKGDSVRKISKKLEENNFIKSRMLFETFVILFGGEKNIKVGDYVFKEKLSVIRLAQNISLGIKGLSPIKITIPEGFTNEEIASLISEKLKNFNKNNFLNKVSNKQGYLFPDTYFFLTSDDENVVIESLENNFKKRTKDVFINLSEEKVKEIIVMASIIEGEANGDNDREIISGILWKRISINMALQVDIAPITYKERGLPNIPINNPGLKAINASLKPKSSPYLYYIHDKEGNTYYGKDFKEHRQNIEKYLK